MDPDETKPPTAATPTADQPRRKRKRSLEAVAPPEQINEADQALLMQSVRPSSGYALMQLVRSQKRVEIGFSAETKAFAQSAFLQVIKTHPSDDEQDIQEGMMVFASMEGLAPLLNTTLFLVPIARVAGIIPDDGLPPAKAYGFG